MTNRKFKFDHDADDAMEFEPVKLGPTAEELARMAAFRADVLKTMPNSALAAEMTGKSRPRVSCENEPRFLTPDEQVNRYRARYL